VILKVNDAGKASIVILASGDEVPVSALPRTPGGYVKGSELARSYDIQLLIDDQLACHGMSYDIDTAPDVHVNKVRGEEPGDARWPVRGGEVHLRTLDVVCPGG